MKNLLFSCLGLMFIFLFFGCNGGAADNVKNAKDSNAARIDSQTAMAPLIASSNHLSRPDADFLVNAASGAMMEVELGQLAQTHSALRRVKNFGAMMVKDHGEGMKQLQRLAARKEVLLPDSVSSHQQKQIDELKKKKGEDFDKAYVRMMVDDHKADIKEFENQAGKAMDSLTRIFASSSLQMLRRHLDSANNLVGLLGINYVRGEPIIPH